MNIDTAKEIKRRINSASARYPHIHAFGVFLVNGRIEVVGIGTDRHRRFRNKPVAGYYNAKAKPEWIAEDLEVMA